MPLPFLVLPLPFLVLTLPFHCLQAHDKFGRPDEKSPWARVEAPAPEGHELLAHVVWCTDSSRTQVPVAWLR